MEHLFTTEIKDLQAIDFYNEQSFFKDKLKIKGEEIDIHTIKAQITWSMELHLREWGIRDIEFYIKRMEIYMMYDILNIKNADINIKEEYIEDQELEIIATNGMMKFMNITKGKEDEKIFVNKDQWTHDYLDICKEDIQFDEIKPIHLELDFQKMTFTTTF